MKRLFAVLAAILVLASAAGAAPYLALFGSDAENRVYHFYINESAGETNVVTFEFWPNDGTPTEAQVFTTLNTPGVEVWNSSKEWTDIDNFTNNFSRVGHPK